MKLFENSQDIFEASSDCTDFHLNFLENIEADLQENPVTETRKVHKKSKSLNITKHEKMKSSKIFKL